MTRQEPGYEENRPQMTQMTADEEKFLELSFPLGDICVICG
jgi:hypothetical protein